MTRPEDRLGIEFISVYNLPPVEFVDLAADLGCRHIGMALAPMFGNPCNFPIWSLRDDAGLRRDLVAALKDRDVSISLGEGFLIRPDTDIRGAARDLDLMRELGAARVNAVCIESDFSRGRAQLAAFAEMARARGMDATLEFMPGLLIGDIASATAAVLEANQPNLRLLLDFMHVARSGSKPADLAKVDPDLIGYIQLCDVPLVSKQAYADEARYARRAPGDGELPLFDYLSALPRDLVVGLETPMLARAEAGESVRDILAPCIKAARDLLRRVEQ